MDETYIKVAGQWKYLYRAVDKAGDTVDFLLTATRDKAVAQRYLERAINLHGLPEKTTIDKSGANTAAIHSVNAHTCLEIELRRSKYLNNIVEQDHRAVKRITDPILGFKSFWSAQKLISGIETMHMIKKGQLLCPDGRSISVADQFYSLLCGHHPGSASQRRHIAPTSRRQAAGSKFNKLALPKSTWTPQGPGRKIRLLNTLLFPRSAYSLYEVDDALQ